MAVVENNALRTGIAGMSLEALREHYRRYLFEEYLPFWDRHGIDHELGGFMCSLDHDGTRVNTDKSMWYQGRGLWVYSYLYNHFGGEHYLEVAKKARDFLVRHGRDENGDWVMGLSREGRVTSPAIRRGYAGMFVAEGLQEYAKATGDQESMDLAIDSLWRAMKAWDDPTCPSEEGYIPVSYPGMRPLGSHMVAILILTQMLEQISDPKLEALADRVVDAIVNRFWNPAYQLLNEALNHDYERADDDNEDFVYLGHAIETLWMMLPEAMRRKDRALFELMAERFKRHIEVAWDDVCGGIFRGMKVHGAFIFDKVLWAQEEVLIGTMILMEHTDLEWPVHWFDRTFAYVEDKFSLKQYGFPLYSESGDRQVIFRPHVARKENYHHPRHVMRNLLALERMIGRGGKVSRFWEEARGSGQLAVEIGEKPAKTGAIQDTRHLVETPEKRAAYFEKMLKLLCADLGPHPSGTREFERAAWMIHKELGSAFPISFLDRYLDKWELVGFPEIIHRGKRLTIGVAENCAGTSDAGFNGIIRRIDTDGIPYGIVDVATGKIAACINVSAEVGVQPEYLIGRDVLSLPRFTIGIQDVPFVELLVKDQAQVQVRLRVVHAPEVPTYNIVGTLPGESSDEIMLMAHADSIIMTQGANDNTATAIIMLMLAHVFSGTKPHRTLTVVVPGSEEYGYMGARHYAKRREIEGTARNLKFIINCDSLTYGPNLWPSTKDRELMALVKEIHADLSMNTEPIYSADADWWMNDASCFRTMPHARGINFNSRGYATLAANHTPDDNAENVPRDCVESAFVVLRELINRLQDL